MGFLTNVVKPVIINLHSQELACRKAPQTSSEVSRSSDQHHMHVSKTSHEPLQAYLLDQNRKIIIRHQILYIYMDR